MVLAKKTQLASYCQRSRLEALVIPKFCLLELLQGRRSALPLVAPYCASHRETISAIPP